MYMDKNNFDSFIGGVWVGVAILIIIFMLLR